MIDLKMLALGLVSVLLVVASFRLVAAVRICYYSRNWQWKIMRSLGALLCLALAIYCGLFFVIYLAFDGIETIFIFMSYLVLAVFCAYLAIFAKPNDLFILSWPPIEQ